MARAALGWGIRDLARIAKVSTDTISRLERGEQLKDRTFDDLGSALEAAGIEFLPDNGVRLKAQPAPKRRDRPSGGSSSSTRKPAATGKTAPRAKKPAPDRQSTGKALPVDERVAPRAKKPGKSASAPKAKALPMSKEAQIRALREQGAG